MRHRFTVLDSFRGLFAFLVAVYHFQVGGPVSQFILVRKGDHFVDFFFVLSGFIIYYSCRDLTKGESQSRFLKNRFFRLYPLHLFMLIIFLGMEIMKYILYSKGIFKSSVFEKNNLLSFSVNLLFLQSFNITPLSWNYPSWSISAEIVAYLVFSLFIVYLKYISTIVRSTFFFILSSIALILIWKIENTLNILLTNNWGFLRCLYGFFIGCLVYEIYKILAGYIGRINILVASMLEITFLTVGLSLTSYIQETQNFILPLVYSLTILIFAFEKGILSIWLNNRVFNRIGELSYSIYMVHAAIAIVFEMIILFLKLKSDFALTIVLIGYLLIIYIVSTLTHQYIEIKLRKWLQQPKRFVTKESVTA